MTTPWMTTLEAAEYLRIFDKDGKPNADALMKLLVRNACPTHRLGKLVRVRRDVLDGLLREVRVSA